MAAAIPRSAEERVIKVFLQAIETAGGLRSFVENRQLQLLPVLIQSAYVVVLSEDEQRSPQAIADFLGTTTAAVESVFAAPMEGAVPRLTDALKARRGQIEPQAQLDRLEPEYFVGSLAKFAYQTVNRQRL